jgi:tripartite-type tricarboxylate transporter receptor subunit TctC
VEFDLTRFSWLGSAVKVPDVCVVRAAIGVNTIEDMIKNDKQVIMGGGPVGSGLRDVPVVMNAALGTKFKIIAGYDGSNQIRLAMERGEVDGGCWSWDNVSATPEWFEGPSAPARVIVVFAENKPNHPALRDVPTAMSLARTEEGRGMLRMMMAPAQMGKPYLSPPETHPERLAALRAAFLATFNDPRFKEEADKAKYILEPSTSDQVTNLVRGALDQPAALKARLKEVLNAET